MNSILDSRTANTNTVFGKTNTYLLNTILALFHRGYLGTYDRDFVESSLKTIEMIKPQGFQLESNISFANDILSDIIFEIAKSDKPLTPDWLSIRLKPLKVDHESFVNVIISEFADIGTLSDETIKERYRLYRQLCDGYKEGFLLKQVARESFASVLNSSEANAEQCITEALEKIAPLLGNKHTDDIKLPRGISSYVKSSDEEAMAEQFEEAKKRVDTRSVLKCGVQGWDRSLSDYGGLLRGQVVEIQATSGGSKSETVRMYMAGVGRHTKPFLMDEKKKPALVYITMEDSISRSISRVLTILRREKYERYDIPELSEEESVVQYREFVESTGYTVINLRGRQKELTPKGIVAALQAISDDGYEIHICAVDYMGVLSFTDTEEANNSESIKTGYSILFTYLQEQKIAGLLCGQIAGGQYGKITEECEKDGLPKLVDGNLSSQSMNIINVLDTRVMVHVVKGDNRAFHQWAVGKNREGTAMPTKDKYCVYELHRALDHSDGIMKPAGFVPPDIYTECRALRSTPSVKVAEAAEAAFSF